MAVKRDICKIARLLFAICVHCLRSWHPIALLFDFPPPFVVPELFFFFSAFILTNYAVKGFSPLFHLLCQISNEI